ncbi:MAG: ComF family protein [Bacillota bacterium]|nr:ComF family protein [Bacillota bacterium]
MVTKLFKKTVDLIYPPICPFCESVIKSGQMWCEDCYEKFPENGYFTEFSKDYVCVSPFIYKEPFREAVLRFKFNELPQLADSLSEPVYRSINEFYENFEFDFVTCVPLSKKRFKKRGYNQAKLIAKNVAVKMNVPYADLLIKIKENAEQHNLPEEKRASNVEGVYQTINNEKISEKTILLIDDVLTTGSTLAECCKMLEIRGAAKVFCATITVVHNENN